MTEADRDAFTTAFIRVCAQQGRPFDAARCASYFESRLVATLPAEGVIEAMELAVADSGSFIPELGKIVKLYHERRGAGRGAQAHSHAPAVERDEHGRVVARYRCVFCADSGWRPVLTATGQTLSEAELQEWERTEKPDGPREDGRPHVMRRKCACKVQGAAA
jgi:hypothetical protein